MRPNTRSVRTHSIDTIRPLHARYVAGEDAVALAAELGISKGALLCQFHHKGLGGRVKRHWWTRAELTLSQERIERGMSIDEAARLVGVKPVTLYRELLDFGYSAKTVSTHESRVRRDKEDFRLYSLRQKGLSYAKIAREMGWPEDLRGQRRVGRRLNRYCFIAVIPMPNVTEVLRVNGTRRRIGSSKRVKDCMERRLQEARRVASEAQDRHR